MSRTSPSILILSWRDIRSDKCGGAEVYTHEIFSRLVSYGWHIEHLSPKQAGLPAQEEIDGIQYIRCGNILSVIAHAARLYYRNRYNIVVDQCNTHRFFTPFWLHNAHRVFLLHQLTREIWHYNLPFPFSYIGEITESLFGRLYKNTTTITVSESTATDLFNLGFKVENVHIVPNGFTMPEHTEFTQKARCTFVYLGRFSLYKRIDHVIQAFALLKEKYREAKLWLIGKPDDKIVKDVLTPILTGHGLTFGHSDKDNTDVILWGYVDEDTKKTLLSQATALIFPALREGWGRTISEAALCGTPSIVYDAPGVIDAVDTGNAGFVASQHTPASLAIQMQTAVDDDQHYKNIQANAYRFTKQFTWDNSTKQMNEIFQQKLINNLNIDL